MGAKRAVRLTAEGRKKLATALDERWKTEFPGRRQTRQARAGFLHLSVATTQKLLAGQPVDKSTVQLACQRVGLRWDESLVVREGDQAPGRPLPAPRTTAPPNRRPQWPVLLAALASGAVLLAVSISRPPATAVVEPWRHELNGLLASGTQAYNGGRYGDAEAKFARALEIAQRQDVAGGVAESLRMLGDIAAARGDLRTARARYIDALDIRQKTIEVNAGPESKRLERVLPPLYEALGAVEARLGMPKEAERRFRLALAGYAEQRVPAGVAMAYRGLGSLAHSLGNTDQALRAFDEALAALEPKDKNSDLSFDIRARAAVASCDQGDASASLATLRQCLRHWQAKGHVRWVATTHLQLAIALSKSGDATSAGVHAGKAQQGFETVGDAAGARRARELIGEVTPQTRRPG